VSIRFKPELRVFVFHEYVDLRAGFNRLSMVVRDKIGGKIVDGDLYLFLGKNRKRIKALCYDGTGLVLIAKRMERGTFTRLEDLEEKEITVEELDWLLRGSVVRRPKFGVIPLTKKPEFPELN
jgi:transposase